MKPGSSKGFKSDKNVILITSNLKETINHLQNSVPVKAYDGKRSKNSTLMNLALYLFKKFMNAEDVRKVVEGDFLSLSPLYEDLKEALKKPNL